MTLSQLELELFAEDTVRENKVQQEKIAERDSHSMILNETCRDFEGQLAQFHIPFFLGCTPPPYLTFSYF
jgi:hypothetical protein